MPYCRLLLLRISLVKISTDWWARRLAYRLRPQSPNQTLHEGTMVDGSFFGEHARFHHVGLAVRSIEDVMPTGAEIVLEPNQGVRLAFMRLHGITIELLEPAGEDSPISASLQKG